MISYLRTNGNDADFKRLVDQLDAYLKIVDGSLNVFYHQFNSIENIPYVLMAYENQTAIGCGSFKQYDRQTVELKRMFVLPAKRKLGVAGGILNRLEQWAAELSFGQCILETGKGQPEAIAFYIKNGYHIIPNFGQYAGVENSLCFEKTMLFSK